MSSGTISAMISSLKSNNSLRRKKKDYSIFYKKSASQSYVSTQLSKEENLQIIERNKRKLKRNSRYQLIFGLLMVLLYGSIITFTLLILFK